MKRRGLSCLLALAAAAAVTGCGVGMPKPVAEPAALKAPAYGDYKALAQVRESHPLDPDFLEAVTDFSCRSAAVVLAGNRGENLNYSPVSLYMALSLLSAGARGETEQQLLTALGLEGQDTGYLAGQSKNLFHRLYTDNRVGVCQIANSVWVDKQAAFTEKFAHRASEDYYATLFEADFQDRSTERAMQKWIERQTHGHLSPEIHLTSEQSMALINTLYFKDAWSNEFSKKETKPDSFHLSDGQTMECDFMNRTVNPCPAIRGDGFTAACLYLKNRGKMVFVLPDTDEDLNALTADGDRIREMMEWEEAFPAKVVFRIPKFDFSCDIDLKGVVEQLGLSGLMGPEADFSGLLTQPKAWLQSLRQQARIAIDEKGVESSAATEILSGSAAPAEDKTVEMILDRPFLFGILDETGIPLFWGICQDPTSA